MKKHEERLKVIITDEQGDGVEGVGGWEDRGTDIEKLQKKKSGRQIWINNDRR